MARTGAQDTPAGVHPGRTLRPELTALERLVLFVCSQHGQAAPGLLEALAEPQRTPALELASSVLSWDRSVRQARVAVELGPRPGGRQRLAELLAASAPRFRLAVVDALPPALRAEFPQYSRLASDAAPSPALAALAARLVRERMA